jgi:ubiquitin-conjugating enzyme E2 M
VTSTCICRGGEFLFDFNISTGYPHDAPKVKCLTRVRLRWALGCTAAWRLHSVSPYTHALEDRLHCVHERRHYKFIFRQVYHPNIDTEGNICLNILREDWKPVLSINSVVYGLNFLFLVRSPAVVVSYKGNNQNNGLIDGLSL